MVAEEIERFLEISDPPRTAIYKARVPTMDEGWTRWVFEQSGPNYSSLDDKNNPEKTDLSTYRTIVIPDQSPRTNS